jgi:FtsP/CotA-like multicopper oxidase with cupredoxin domain
MSSLRPLCLIVCTTALAACGNNATDPAGATPDAALEADAAPDPAARPALFAPDPAAPADDDPQPAEFEDLNPDPAVVEVDLTASETTQAFLPGAPTRVWAYNGRVPGPTLSARPGDRVIVHFHNRLPEATTIHWHGLRVPLDQDGVPVDGGVAPGADRDYDFVVPDAGTFWYHPHVRSDEQVERGLYGAIRVAEAAPVAEVELPERVLVLDDVLLEADGALADFDYTDDDAHLGAHAGHLGTVMLGREGNLLLVNGVANPALHLDRARPERWRVVNAANARYLNLSLPGYRVRRLASSGGLLPAPEAVPDSGLVLVPGERADLLVEATADTPDTVVLRALAYDRGHGTDSRPDVDLARVQATGVAPAAPLALPEPLRAFEPLESVASHPRVVLNETVAIPGGHEAHGATGDAPAEAAEAPAEPVFTINGEVFPEVTPMEAGVGRTVSWDIVNDSQMDHPFHLHGFFFAVPPNAAGRNARPGLHDTINIPRRDTVRIQFQPDDRPGDWMFHCHILEHAERGMIGVLRVAP